MDERDHSHCPCVCSVVSASKLVGCWDGGVKFIGDRVNYQNSKMSYEFLCDLIMDLEIFERNDDQLISG